MFALQSYSIISFKICQFSNVHDYGHLNAFSHNPKTHQSVAYEST